MKLLLSTLTATTLLLSPTPAIYKTIKSDYYDGLVWDKINWEREWENQSKIDMYNVETSTNTYSPNIEFKDIAFDPNLNNGTLSFDMRFNFTTKDKQWMYDSGNSKLFHYDEFKVHVGLYESEDKNPYDLNEKHSSETFTYNKYAMQDIDNDKELDSLDFTYVLPTSENVWNNYEYVMDDDGDYRVKYIENSSFDNTYTWKPYDENGNQMLEWVSSDPSITLSQEPNLNEFIEVNPKFFEGYGEDASSIIDLGIEGNAAALEFTNLNNLFDTNGLENKNLYLFANIYLTTPSDGDYSGFGTEKYYVSGNTDNNYDVPMMVYNGYFVEDMNIEEIDSNVSYKKYKIDTTINGVNKDSSADEIEWANEFVVPYNVEVYDNTTNELITTTETFSTINGENTFMVPVVSDQELRFEINQEKIDVPNEFYGNEPVHQEVVINTGTLPEVGHIDYIDNFNVVANDGTTATATFESLIYYLDSIVEVEPYTISVVDQDGNILQSSTLTQNGEQTIELTGLTPGKEYTLTLQSDSENILIDSDETIKFSIPEESNSSIMWIIIGILIAIFAIAAIVGGILFAKNKK